MEHIRNDRAHHIKQSSGSMCASLDITLAELIPIPRVYDRFTVPLVIMDLWSSRADSQSPNP